MGEITAEATKIEKELEVYIAPEDKVYKDINGKGFIVSAGLSWGREIKVLKALKPMISMTTEAVPDNEDDEVSIDMSKMFEVLLEMPEKVSIIIAQFCPEPKCTVDYVNTALNSDIILQILEEVVGPFISNKLPKWTGVVMGVMGTTEA